MTAADQLGTETQTTTWRATVALRIPRNGDGDLVSESRRRLERTRGIQAATVESMAGLEPALAATVARLEVSVESYAREEAAVRDALGEVAGLQRVDHLDPG